MVSQHSALSPIS